MTKTKRTKLTKEQVLEIYNLVQAGETRQSVADIYQINIRTVDAITSGECHSHITGKAYAPSSCHKTILTKDQVLEIYNLVQVGGATFKDIAGTYQVGIDTVHRIASGERHSRITGKVFTQKPKGQKENTTMSELKFHGLAAEGLPLTNAQLEDVERKLNGFKYRADNGESAAIAKQSHAKKIPAIGGCVLVQESVVRALIKHFGKVIDLSLYEVPPESAAEVLVNYYANVGLRELLPDVALDPLPDVALDPLPDVAIEPLPDVAIEPLPDVVMTKAGRRRAERLASITKACSAANSFSVTALTKQMLRNVEKYAVLTEQIIELDTQRKRICGEDCNHIWQMGNTLHIDPNGTHLLMEVYTRLRENIKKTLKNQPLLLSDFELHENPFA